MDTLTTLQTSTRIIWAIARKDMVDAIKNKTILTVLVTVAFVVLMYRALPYLEDEQPALLLHDAGDSVLTAQLETSPNLRLYTYGSPERVEDLVPETDSPEIGLIFPKGLDQQIQEGRPVRLDGYVAYWIPEDQVRDLQQLVAREMASLAGRPVAIEFNVTRLYPLDPGHAAGGFMVSIAVVLVLAMIGILVVVHLMLEEKQTKTLDALRVAPVTPLQMLLGKAVTGMAYCLLGMAIVFALNGRYITNWGLALAAAFCGALLAVGLDIWLGTLFDSRQQLTMWGLVLMAILLLPPFLVILESLFPAPVIAAAHWVPTAAVAWLIRASFPPHAAAGPALLRLGYILLWTAGMYALAAWQVRRLER